MKNPNKYFTRIKINGAYSHGFYLRTSGCTWKNPNAKISISFVINLRHKNFKSSKYKKKLIQIRLNKNYNILALITTLVSLIKFVFGTVNDKFKVKKWVIMLCLFAKNISLPS